MLEKNIVRGVLVVTWITSEDQKFGKLEIAPMSDQQDMFLLLTCEYWALIYAHYMVWLGILLLLLRAGNTRSSHFIGSCSILFGVHRMSMKPPFNSTKLEKLFEKCCESSDSNLWLLDVKRQV